MGGGGKSTLSNEAAGIVCTVDGIRLRIVFPEAPTHLPAIIFDPEKAEDGRLVTVDVAKIPQTTLERYAALWLASLARAVGRRPNRSAQ